MGLIINGAKMGKPYINNIKRNAYIGGQKIWSGKPSIPEKFSFTVQDGGSFSTPTRGVNGSSTSYQSYNWIINWGDGKTQTVSGAGTSSSSIPHTYTDRKNTHTIIIKPNGTATQVWLNAFGCFSSDSENAKIISINTPITELMRTMGIYSHYAMFNGCTKLTDIGNIDANWFSARSPTQSRMFNGCTNIATGWK